MSAAYEVEIDSCGRLQLHNYTDLSDEQHHQVLAMRNHPEIKQWMYNSESISLQEHMRFIDALKTDASKQYFLVTSETDVLGSVNLKHIDKQSSMAELGLFTNPEMKIKGLGKCLLAAIEAYAFDVLSLATLQLEVFSSNSRAIALYEKFSYQPVANHSYDGRELISMRKSR